MANNGFLFLAVCFLAFLDFGLAEEDDDVAKDVETFEEGRFNVTWKQWRHNRKCCADKSGIPIDILDDYWDELMDRNTQANEPEGYYSFLLCMFEKAGMLTKKSGEYEFNLPQGLIGKQDMEKCIKNINFNSGEKLESVKKVHNCFKYEVIEKHDNFGAKYKETSENE